MKQYTAPSTDSLARIPLAAMLAAGVALCAASCVSEPAPAAPPPQAAVVEAVIPLEPERAQILDSLRLAAPRGPSTNAKLPEPESPTVAAVPTAIPTDITVLSRIKDALVAPALPEPQPPARAEPAAVAAAPVQAAKPTAPATPKPTPPKSVPAATTEAKPVEAKPAEPKPTVAKPAEAQATQAAEPAVSLPAAPSSSARSIAAAQPKPAAETRLETVRGERFELRFPGSGWIYLGDEDGKEGLRYETRRFEGTQAIFALNPESPGEYLLRFQRENPVDRSTEVSLVRVVVADKAAAPSLAAPAAGSSAEPARAPVAPSPSPSPAPAPAPAPASPASSVAATAPAAAVSPSASPASSAPLPSDPAELIRLAKAELEAKRAQSAIAALDRYLSLYPVGNDELFYLYGLAFEQDTPFRNIKKAYENYRRVKDEYPRSQRWREAADRVAFLERHYFGLR